MHRPPIPSSGSPALVSPGLLEAQTAAITDAIATGQWGDACFVVKSSSGDFAFVRFWAWLNLLRANGADYLADRVEQSSFDCLEDAVAALRSPAAAHSQPTRTTSKTRAENGHRQMLYYPVSNICATTMRAIIDFLQTGNIQFAPVTSFIEEFDDEEDHASVDTFVDIPEERASQTQALPVGPTFSSAVVTSPKSVYRAAKKYRLVFLQRLASSVIDEQITPKNCLNELFGSLSLRYAEVFEKRLEYVLQHWNEIEDKAQLSSLITTTRNHSRAIDAFNAIIKHTSITH
ncbi:hypothetical protein PHSY_002414 [Pseudozyma hubeiensis SY62]|uniref:BTB domain-containing protein n=1 Tax=Pseudozyma hubeiensis (strain SY62) TaxID=1305764 RepID=R9P0Z2_PSEHS|nr:hypothetical protein PHSY_002414 [Pseudozyma hubeiensis SY62]GAC94841.1 hypothetical protein PHSY_002414 [Pseudozyma hubeiensis SY62]